ncbi:MAG: hypothetical protein M3Z24_13035, partial [Chloroflexota bacterium]|nr:hypothetical protein [Chloroflexota bacterium]
DINYTFPYNAPRLLVYHLTSVDIRYAYNGAQAKGGQQIYVFHFRVDNSNGIDISPGYGYDYIRLIVNGSPRSPMANTLPYTFTHGKSGVVGEVAFAAPVGMKSATLDFLVQFGSGGTNYTVQM